MIVGLTVGSRGKCFGDGGVPEAAVAVPAAGAPRFAPAEDYIPPANRWARATNVRAGTPVAPFTL